MLNHLKKKWRKAHLNKDHIKINTYWRFNKKTKRFYSINNLIPNLLIIGSQKCGTSSLHRYLNEHPDIYMSAPEKEPGFFIFEQWGKKYWKNKGRIINSRKELLTKYMIGDSYTCQKYFGEGSTHYTVGDRVINYDIVSIIKKESKNARIIYIIRNPFERIISNYYHMVKYWAYNKSFDDFILEDENAIKTTLYFQQIKPFIDEFKNDVLLLLFEDMIAKPQITLDKVYQFLGLNSHLNEEFKVFNKTKPDGVVKISSQAYVKLGPIFKEEKRKIEDYFDLLLPWDLSSEIWVE